MARLPDGLQVKFKVSSEGTLEAMRRAGEALSAIDRTPDQARRVTVELEFDAPYRCPDPGCLEPAGERVICERCGRHGCDGCIVYDPDEHAYICDHCP